MRYFVTGATGFIGGYVTSHLLAQGHSVSALVRTATQARALAEYGVRPHVGDLLDRESLRRGMRRTDGVFHLAGFHRYLGRRYRKVARAINVTGTRNVLEVMSELRIPRGVYTSDLALFGDTGGRPIAESDPFAAKHRSVYARTKWEAHSLVALPMMRDGLPLTIVMPGTVYGPGDTSRMGVALRDYLRGRSPLLPSSAVYSWAHVSDVAFGHLLAMQRGRPGATYILAGAPHPLREVFIRAGRLIGRRHDPPTVPRFALGAAASGLRALQMVIPRLGPAAEWVRTIGGTGWVGDDTRARVELGFEPRSLDEGLPDTVRAHLDDLMEWIR